MGVIRRVLCTFQMTLSVNTQTCTKCGESKPADRTHFGSTPSGGLRRVCRVCGRAASKAYDSKHPDKVRARAAKSQCARKGFIPTDALRDSLLSEQHSLCGLCGQPMNASHVHDSKFIQVEHLLPSSKGGTNDRSNLVLSHRSCNQEKKQKSVTEYLSWRYKVGLPAPSCDLP